MSNKSDLKIYKRFCHMVLLTDMLLKEPERHYKFIFDVLTQIYNINLVKETNINYNKTMKLLLYGIDFLENHIL